MKSFKEYLVETTGFKHAKQWEVIDSVLEYVDARSRKAYVERLNKMTYGQLQQVENSIDANAIPYINDSEAKGTYSLDKEMEISVNAMEAAIDSILN